MIEDALLLDVIFWVVILIVCSYVFLRYRIARSLKEKGFSPCKSQRSDLKRSEINRFVFLAKKAYTGFLEGRQVYVFRVSIFTGRAGFHIPGILVYVPYEMWPAQVIFFDNFMKRVHASRLSHSFVRVPGARGVFSSAPEVLSPNASFDSNCGVKAVELFEGGVVMLFSLWGFSVDKVDPVLKAAENLR